MDTTIPDLRRACHCGRGTGIGPHYHSRQEGCLYEEPVDTIGDRPALAEVTTEPEPANLECDRCARLQTTIEELADLVARLRREQTAAAPEQPTAGPERVCGDETTGYGGAQLVCAENNGHEPPHRQGMRSWRRGGGS